MFSQNDSVEASIDICINIDKVVNLTSNKIGPIAFCINVNSGDSEGIPYQCIPKLFAYKQQYQAQSHQKSNSQYSQSQQLSPSLSKSPPSMSKQSVRKNLNPFGKISMETYTSQFFNVKAESEFKVPELIVFKLHVPIEAFQNSNNQHNLSFTISIFTRSEYLNTNFIEQNGDHRFKDLDNFTQDVKCLDKMTFTMKQILYLDTFVPCTFERYGIAIQSTIKTHLLSFKYKKLHSVLRHQLYQLIDHLVISYNKIREKTLQYYSATTTKLTTQYQQSQMQSQQQSCTKLPPNQIVEESVHNQMLHTHFQNPSSLQGRYLNTSATKHDFQHLPAFIDMRVQPEFQTIRNFVQSRIFTQESMKDHRAVLNKFIEKFLPRMTEKLLLIWKIYLQQVLQLEQQLTASLKMAYMTDLTILYKNRIEFRYPKSNISGVVRSLSRSNFSSSLKSKRRNYQHSSRPYSSEINQSRSVSLPRVQLSSQSRQIEQERYIPKKSYYQEEQLRQETGAIAKNNLGEHFSTASSYHQKFKKIQIAGVSRSQPLLKVLVQQQILTSEAHLKSTQERNMIEKIQYQNQMMQVSSMKEPHIIVLVHGMGACSSAFDLFEVYLRYFHSNSQERQLGDRHSNKHQEDQQSPLLILNSSANQRFVNQSIQVMSDRLVFQIQEFFHQKQLHFQNSFKISFIGHSLGGLIIRASLPKLQKYKFYMKTFITMSAPHLGYFYHNSSLNKMGMWTLQKVFKNRLMKVLLMKDTRLQDSTNESSPDYHQSSSSYPTSQYRQFNQDSYRNTFLYRLSQAKGLGWFQDVVFCSSIMDYFVSPISALVSSNEEISEKCCSYQNDEQEQEGNECSHGLQPKINKAIIWEEMRLNILNQIVQQTPHQTNLHRLTVKFSQESMKFSNSTLKDYITGKNAHVLYLSETDFIEYLIASHRNWFN